MSSRPPILTVNAFDARGEEGLSGDALVCDALGCRAVGVATAIMTPGVEGLAVFELLAPSWIERQWAASIASARPLALRIGILRGEEQVRLVASLVRRDPVPNVVVAPVVRIGGQRVLDAAAVAALSEEAYPLARVVVVRAAEIAQHAGVEPDGLEDLRRAAAKIREMGARAVLVTGWVAGSRVVDMLDDGGEHHVFDTGRLAAPRLEGIGNAHATALAAHLARGLPLDRAVQGAQRYVGLRLQRGI
jgi:hydroxymethylpyrimidine/phosphomethylpyrimidine kinase